MNHEFEVWVKFVKDGKTITTGRFFSYESFEHCWDNIVKKEIEMRKEYPNIIAEYMHSAVSQRPDYSDY